MCRGSRKSIATEKCAEIYCDGASNGNPGHAGVGVVIKIQGSKCRIQMSKYIGLTTNNVAEYLALIKGLKKARVLKLKNIKVFLDSELVVKQINGTYKVRDKNLKLLWTEVKEILKDFDNYVITHIRREINREADLLAKKAVQKGKGF